MDVDKVGIYFNKTDSTVVRITSPYWIPEEPDWVLVSNDPNLTLLAVRDLIAENNLGGSSESIQWTGLKQSTS